MARDSLCKSQMVLHSPSPPPHRSSYSPCSSSNWPSLNTCSLRETRWLKDPGKAPSWGLLDSRFHSQDARGRTRSLTQLKTKCSELPPLKAISLNQTSQRMLSYPSLTADLSPPPCGRAPASRGAPSPHGGQAAHRICRAFRAHLCNAAIYRCLETGF